MRVFVLDKNLNPLDPTHPARARELLNKGRAKVFKRYPFTIVLQDRAVEESTVHSHRIKIDPGSKTTGVAVVLIHHYCKDKSDLFGQVLEPRLPVMQWLTKSEEIMTEVWFEQLLINQSIK